MTTSADEFKDRITDWSGLLVATLFAVESGGAKKTDSAIWVTRGIPSIDIDDPLSIVGADGLSRATPESPNLAHRAASC